MGVFIMTFNVGDKVRVVANNSSHKFSIGSEVTLVRKFETLMPKWLARSGSATWYINESEFEPIGKPLQELKLQVGDVVRATAGSFERYGNFTCTGISYSDNYRGYRYMNSEVYPKGLFGPENGLWEIVSREAVNEPTPPRKMHPDDFIQAVNDFARDNGFKLSYISGETDEGTQFNRVLSN